MTKGACAVPPSFKLIIRAHTAGSQLSGVPSEINRSVTSSTVGRLVCELSEACRNRIGRYLRYMCVGSLATR